MLIVWIRKYFVATALTLLSCCSVIAEIVINEVQSSNSSTSLDEDGDASDWIELYNSGPTNVNLEGWGLSDNPDKPMKWLFPAVELASGEHLLLYASGKDRTNSISISQINSPDEIPGLVMWFNADSESYSHGAAVATFNDRSATGNNGTQSTTSMRPTYVTNAVNGHAAFRFDRAKIQSMILDTSDFKGTTTLRDISLFYVCKWGGQATSGLFGAWAAGSSSSQHCHFEISNTAGSTRLRMGNIDSGSHITGMFQPNQWGQVAAVMRSAGDNPEARAYANGELRHTLRGDPGNLTISGYGKMEIGRSDENRQFGGEMAEVVMFNRALTEVEISQVARYLAQRYGTPLHTAAAQPKLHTNFSLKSEGESVLLHNPATNLMEQVDLPTLLTDSSYGRVADGASTFGYFAEPTPAAANSTTSYAEPPLDPVIFSMQRGIYETPFSLTLSCASSNSEIYYTTDGSEPSMSVGVLYDTPITVGTTTVVRAVAYKADALPQRSIQTHTYLFLDDVLTRTSRPDGYPATWGGFQQVSYSISANAAAQPGYSSAMRAALQAVPVISLSMSADDLFGAGGIYSNPEVDGLEKAVSVEWITNGVGQVQLDAGLRVQGGASRKFVNTPKKSLRLLFKAEYGPGRLKTPVLKDEGSDLADFNTLVLRAEYNNSWVHWEAEQRLRGIYIRDQWVRDTQIAMRGSGSHGGHVHLFLNGIYWGLYNLAERPDAAFGANYFGGEREDYDAMTHDGIRDGDNIAWNQMIAVAKGDLTTRAQYELLGQYLDIDHFIDYMIVNIYGGNSDWPHNNWNAIRRREAGAGYLFYCWDSERTLEGGSVNQAGVTGQLNSSANSASFYTALRASSEFRLRFADRLHKHCFNGGALVPQNAIARLEARMQKSATAVFAESARWGAYRNEIYDRNGPSPAFTCTDWSNECARITNSYFPGRTATVLNQFKAVGLYPATAAPEFSQHGGVLEYNKELSITAAAGLIYVTVDGVDPRRPFTGGVYSNAWVYSAPLVLTEGAILKARAYHNGVWSALTEAEFGVHLSEAVFLPDMDGSWQVAGNWSGNVIPNSAGQSVLIKTPLANRNIELYAPVTVGCIRFDHTENEFRDRLQDGSAGSSLTLKAGQGGHAGINVSGNGGGYVEFRVKPGTVVEGTLELDVQHLEGDSEYGALRLRERWNGGDILKTGAGMATFTGEQKNFTGAVEIAEGVLALTASSAPLTVTGCSVADGGQLRLTSSSDPGVPRLYPLGGSITVSGAGRGVEIPEGTAYGKKGALRYDPEGSGSHVVLTNRITLLDETALHVDGTLNTLELCGRLIGSDVLTKSGGGTLLLSGDLSGFSGPVEVATGAVRVNSQAAAVGALTGGGRLVLDNSIVSAPSISGVALDLLFNQAGAPDYGTPASSGNGLLRLDTLEGGMPEIRIFLQVDADVTGGIFVPYSEDLAGRLHEGNCHVYLRDVFGDLTFNGAQWSRSSAAQVVAVAERADFSGGAVAGKIIAVRFGEAPLSYERWKQLMFDSADDRNNPAVSAPLAAPFGDTTVNLMRYALGVTNSAMNLAFFLPQLTLNTSSAAYSFPFASGRDDLRYVVESTFNLKDWARAELLYDSLTEYPENLIDGWMTLEDPARYQRRFYRLRVILR
ncbi:MAG: CotH kinase family protein [Kiritimatiellae bacterium]|nr:CotH kinase family protein [Kiritimatiellia bacterium]